MRDASTTRTRARRRRFASWFGAKDQTKADRLLAKRLLKAFEPLDLPSIESLSLYVKDGDVNVFGLICDEQDRKFFIETARRVPGIRHVYDHIQVVRPADVRPYAGEGAPTG